MVRRLFLLPKEVKKKMPLTDAQIDIITPLLKDALYFTEKGDGKTAHPKVQAVYDFLYLHREDD